MAPGKGDAVVNDLTRSVGSLASTLKGPEILTQRVDETTAKLKEMTRTLDTKVRGWLVLTALGVGAAAGFMGGAFVLVLHGGQLALAPWLGSVGAPLALGGAILALLGAATWRATRAIKLPLLEKKGVKSVQGPKPS